MRVVLGGCRAHRHAQASAAFAWLGRPTALCSANARECQPTPALRPEPPSPCLLNHSVVTPLRAGAGGSLPIWSVDSAYRAQADHLVHTKREAELLMPTLQAVYLHSSNGGVKSGSQANTD